MITQEQFIEMALSFHGVITLPHFDRIGFKIEGMRMFCSYLDKDNTTNIFLSLEEQNLFCEMDPKNIYPLPNKWGEKGVTTFNLNRAPREVVQEALLSAYSAVINSKKSKK